MILNYLCVHCNLDLFSMLSWKWYSALLKTENFSMNFCLNLKCNNIFRESSKFYMKKMSLDIKVTSMVLLDIGIICHQILKKKLFSKAISTYYFSSYIIFCIIIIVYFFWLKENRTAWFYNVTGSVCSEETKPKKRKDIIILV